MQMARATFEGVKKLAPEKRPFVLTRAGFAGVQRYSAVWTGDNYASWEHLALTIPMLTNMSVSGVPFVGADVGGFNDMPSGELYARWLQAAALTPFFRSHSVGWVGNKEPWEFGEEFTKINRSTVELRYQFLPYLYTLFREHERTGAPVMRPLWYEYPNDKLTYLVNDQFMLGSDVLVAPVVKEGMRTRGIYLPAGAEWTDWWTGERFESGKLHYLKTPLDRLPIFVRVGAVIPTQGVIQHTGEMPSAPVTLNVIAGIKPGVTETGRLFQDAGDGYGYYTNRYREITIEHRQGRLTIDRSGNFNGQRIRYIQAIGVGAKPKEMRADGKSLNMDFDSAAKRLRLEINGDEKEILLIR
jgi:alpha-glucosidase